MWEIDGEPRQRRKAITPSEAAGLWVVFLVAVIGCALMAACALIFWVEQQMPR